MSTFCLSPHQPEFPFVWHMKAHIEVFKKCSVPDLNTTGWFYIRKHTHILRLRMVIVNAAIPKN